MKNKSDKNKKGNKILKYLKNKKSELAYLIVGLIVGLLIMLIFWPERVAQLKNGEEVILEIKNKKFTANDLYKELKENNGSETLFNMIDLAILYDKYPDLKDEATSYASEQSEQIYASYQSYYGYTKDEFLATNGFADEAAFLERLKEEYYYKYYYDEYVGATITDKEINKYYKDHVFGEAGVYVFSATDEDNDLENVRKSLKSGKTFDEIKAKYSSVYSYFYESVTFKDTDTLTQTVLDKIASTKKGKYSEVFADDMYGSVVVYVVDKKAKDELDKVKDDIVSMLVLDKQENDGELYYKAFLELRDNYDLNIYDTEIKKMYDDIANQYK